MNVNIACRSRNLCHKCDHFEGLKLHPCCTLLFACLRRTSRRLSFQSVNLWQKLRKCKRSTRDVSALWSQSYATARSIEQQPTLRSRCESSATFKNKLIELSLHRAILTPTFLVEAGRSDPGRHVDGTSHQRSSAVGADQPKGGIQLMPLTLADWAPLPQIVPSQIAASPGVLKNVDG